MIVYVYLLVHLVDIFSWSYILLKIGGKKNAPNYLNVMLN